MGKPAIDITITDLYFVCDDPNCELARGSIGLTAAQIQARVLAAQAEDADADEDAEDADDDDAADADTGEDPADPTAIDPLGVGAACPLCRAADPPRQGKLLAVPTGGFLQRLVAARLGSFGLLFWQPVASDSVTGTNRLIDAQRNASGDATKSKATSAFVLGRKAITAVVLKELPFDGHLLRHGNCDPQVYERTTVPNPKGKGTRTADAWVAVTPKYGVDHGPPDAAARANPAYVRELQEDLIWLGYMSTTRGSPTPGRFDQHTLGAVLGFKQDLVDIYGVAVSPTAPTVAPGSVRAEAFTTAIVSQAAFVSPVCIMFAWCSALRGGKQRPGPGAAGQAVVKFVKRLIKAKTAKTFAPALAELTKRQAPLEALAAGWPHLAALEDVTRPFVPFAPRAASKPVDLLAPPPAGVEPGHPTLAALQDDPVWSSEEFNARSDNRTPFFAELARGFQQLDLALASVGEARTRMPEVTAPAELAAEWEAARTALLAALGRLEKVLTLVRFWILDSSKQVTAWLDHIVAMGTVDRATAVYLKALREGGKIGASRRMGYQLERLAAEDDFGDADAGATFLREECTSRTPNQPGRKATTMPEIFALQFYGNESGLKFTHKLGPFCTRTEDREARIALMGLDTNSHRRGVFDAVFHQGGEWHWSRGWGVGQATERNSTLDGVELRRGLPVMPAGGDAVVHPRSFIDCKESIRDAMDRKVLARFNKSQRRDCSFGAAGGEYYDCHSCLKRFFTSKLTGTDKNGKGGVFVPVSAKTAGNPDTAEGFFVDLERYTAFARAAGGVEDPAEVAKYSQLFGFEAPAADANVAAVLRTLSGKGEIATAVAAVAKAADVDKATLAAAVQAHIAARTQLPCSWMYVRIRYAGTGEQAYKALNTLLNVVGDLKAKSPTVIKHIEEASAKRRGS